MGVATVGVMEEVEIGTTIKEDIMGTDMVGEIIGVKRADIKIREVAMNDGMTVDTTGTNGVAQQMEQFTDHKKEVTLMTGMKMTRAAYLLRMLARVSKETKDKKKKKSKKAVKEKTEEREEVKEYKTPAIVEEDDSSNDEAETK